LFAWQAAFSHLGNDWEWYSRNLELLLNF